MPFSLSSSFCLPFLCLSSLVPTALLAEPSVDEAPSTLSCLVQAAADQPSEVSVTVPDEGSERARLDALPMLPIPLQDAPLHAAITAIANAACINYVAPDPREFQEPVTLSTKVNPWQLLQILAERYGFSLVFRHGVWLFHKTMPDACMSKTYLLRHTNLDVYKASQNAFNLLSGGTSGGGEAAAVGGGLVFQPQTQKLLEDVRELLGQTQGASGKDGPVSGAAKSRVLYLPDVNALFVTASADQHVRVGEYLRLVDQPVQQIRIEARFFETFHEPKLVLGLNPSGAQPGLSLSQLSTKLNLERLGSTPYPDKVLLSLDDLRVQVHALSSDDRSRLVNNPSVVVANNREAYFSVGDEEPFVSSNSINAGIVDGGLGTNQAHVAIRRIGTSVNLVPSLFPGEAGAPARIRLAVRIEIGVLKGFRKINTIEVPVVSSQKYEYTVFVDDGGTLAFGGMAGLAEGEKVSKVPVLGDIPVLGYAFKSRDRNKSQRHLLAYITASVLKPGTQDVAPEFPSKAFALPHGS